MSCEQSLCEHIETRLNLRWRTWFKDNYILISICCVCCVTCKYSERFAKRSRHECTDTRIYETEWTQRTSNRCTTTTCVTDVCVYMHTCLEPAHCSRVCSQGLDLLLGGCQLKLSSIKSQIQKTPSLVGWFDYDLTSISSKRLCSCNMFTKHTCDICKACPGT